MLLLQHAAFFAFGGSNSIASVDLSSAYNGVASFNAAAVGVLTFVGNWAGSVWWSWAGVVLLLAERQRRSLIVAAAKDGDESKGVLAQGGRGEKEAAAKGLWTGHVAVLTVFVAGSVAAVMAACTVLRTHLFVWTVFSPKYLYCVAWSLGQHLVVNVVVGGIVYWLGAVEGGA